MDDLRSRIEKRPIRKILVCLHSNIGDVIMETAAMRWIKKAFPDAELAVNTQFPAALIAQSCRWIDRVTVRGDAKLTILKAGWEAGKPDLFINLHTLSNANRWAAAWGIRARVGMDCKSARLLHQAVPWSNEGLEIPNAMKGIAEAVGATPDTLQPEFTIPASAEDEACQTLDSLGLKEGRFAALNPGASVEKKQWPLENFFEIRDRLAAEGVPSVFVGGPAEAKLLEGSSKPVISAAGKLSLLGSLALLRRSKVLLTADSGLMHGAGAVGTPTVCLMGPMYGRVAPFGEGHIMLHSDAEGAVHDMDSCTGECIRAIGIDSVFDAMRHQLCLASPAGVLH